MRYMVSDIHTKEKKNWFLRYEHVAFKSHDNNLTVASRPTLYLTNQNLLKEITYRVHIVVSNSQASHMQYPALHLFESHYPKEIACQRINNIQKEHCFT